MKGELREKLRPSRGLVIVTLGNDRPAFCDLVSFSAPPGWLCGYGRDVQERLEADRQITLVLKDGGNCARLWFAKWLRIEILEQ